MGMNKVVGHRLLQLIYSCFLQEIVATKFPYQPPKDERWSNLMDERYLSRGYFLRRDPLNVSLISLYHYLQTSDGRCGNNLH